MKNKRILVTGGAGSIGSELVRQLSKQNKIFILDTNETGTYELSEELSRKGHWVKPRVGDVRDKETIQDLFADFKPQVIFHAAAYKHVTPMETYPEEAIRTNILGTYNVIREARKYECLEKFVFVSTDKAVASNSIMGASKRMGEIMAKNQGKGFVVVRFGNVLGSRGSLIPIWERQVRNREPLTVTDINAERYFMTIPEACELVITAAEQGDGGEIFVLDMGSKVNIYELALEVARKTDSEIKLTGLRPGETLTENIMFEEEKERAIKRDKFYIIYG